MYSIIRRSFPPFNMGKIKPHLNIACDLPEIRKCIGEGKVSEEAAWPGTQHVTSQQKTPGLPPVCRVPS